MDTVEGPGKLSHRVAKASRLDDGVSEIGSGILGVAKNGRGGCCDLHKEVCATPQKMLDLHEKLKKMRKQQNLVMEAN